MTNAPTPQEFVSSYEIEQLSRNDATTTASYRFGRGGIDRNVLAEPDDLVLRIIPKLGESWVGAFASGEYEVPPAAQTAVVNWPDPQMLGVVHGGAGYAAPVHAPSTGFRIPLFPITVVYPVSAHGLVIFGDFTELVAYDGPEIAWRSGRLVWDDLRIVRIQGHTLSVAGLNAPAGDPDFEFELDIRAGEAPGRPYRRST